LHDLLSTFLLHLSEHLFALFPKLRAEAAVDEDICGRVDGEQEVADADHDQGPEGEAAMTGVLTDHGVSVQGEENEQNKNYLKSY
jgi:hypothetical protein